MINRREFLGVAAVWAASVSGVAGLRGAASVQSGRFSRLYAPHFGMFRHHAGSDPVDQIRFMSDEGFAVLEDAGLRGKPPRLQLRIGEELARRGMTMGLFTALADFGRPTFAAGSPELRRNVLRELVSAIVTAQRVNGRFLSVVPGKPVPGLPRSVQTQNAIDTLHFCCDLCEARDLILILEPIDHGPGVSRLFLRSATQAAQLCRAVGRPSCRLLLEVYQQAVAGEDLPRLLEATADVLGYVQLADAPGRKEPGTGHIDLRELLDALDAVGYRSVIGMEHGNLLPGRDGERAVIEAYRTLDRPFVVLPST